MRDAPAFQEYAESLLSHRRFRMANSSERGLLWSMRLECWKNHWVYVDPVKLAKCLSLDVEEVKNALTENVLFFFERQGDRFICMELEAYRAELDARRTQRAGNAQATNAKKQAKKKSAESTLIQQKGTHVATHVATHSDTQSVTLHESHDVSHPDTQNVTHLSLVQPKLAEPNLAISGKDVNEDANREFIEGLEEGEPEFNQYADKRG